ncbi:MAG: hypothetical protein HY923_09355 [Elusimicrobia bacterium]|nr:hypothetical protein [Elusimicrobiota bacterium]
MKKSPLKTQETPSPNWFRVIPVVLLLGFLLMRCAILPLPNSGNWKRYFSAEDFKSDTLRDLINMVRRFHPHDSKKEYEDLATHIASHGKAAVPYLVKLAGERTRILIPGLYFGARDYPYLPHAIDILSRIDDPKAIPVLIKLSHDGDLGAAAQRAYSRASGKPGAESEPRYTQEDVRAMLTQCGGIPVPAMRAMARLGAAEALQLMAESENNCSGAPQSLGHGRYADWNKTELTESDVPRFETLLSTLAASSIPNILYLLNGHASQLAKELGSGPSSEMPAEKHRIATRLLKIYQRALRKVCAANSEQPLLWQGRGAASGYDHNNPVEIRIRIQAFAPSVILSVTGGYNEAPPITDDNGVVWLRRKIVLKPGAPFPYDSEVVIPVKPNASGEYRSFSVMLYGRNTADRFSVDLNERRAQ